ncbi:16S rRNA (guanine(527)-N(7))-methyltransferase RsmG [Sphaerochaeta halotolerans]|uniref:16S rRNA (guanine(527)-N(7))-methyltransferase RsmG n=1 Tax=Sphaerochaeta halotolerans TaxID=2293840 RepID=UPI00136F7662|nr:16S rRNA (guanine(527)-N(7))-methyltransferase RsmG [Sphaerochaeta halotolerans]
MSGKYEALIKEGLDAMQLSFSAEQLQQLERYIAEVELFNPIYKLVGAEGDDLVIRHIFDSLSAVGKIGEFARQYETPSFADLGSGAGLPGIPLAIALNAYPFTLVERMERRVNFLRNALVATGLSERVQIAAQDLKQVRQYFDVITFRAFRPLVEILDDVAPILSDGGLVCAYKGIGEQVESELIQVASQCKSRWSAEVFPLTVPHLDANRTLCVLTKI